MKDLPKRTGIYQIKDDIDRLELQIHLQVLTFLPVKSNVPNNNQHEKPEGKRPLESTVRLRWQQKILSPAEEELYKSPSNCITELQKKYHVLYLNKQKQSDGSTRNRHPHKQRAGRRKQQSIENRRSANETIIFTYIQEDDFTPRETISHEPTGRIENEQEDAAVTMYVYAALQPEQQLFTLRWQPKQRLLSIYPDFNDIAENPYVLQTPMDNENYAYAAENVSNAKRLPEHDRMPLIETFLDCHPLYRGTANRDAFQLAVQGSWRCSLLLDIGTAEGFSATSLYIRYQMHLPNRGCSLEEGSLAGTTHSSWARTSALTTVHNFGHSLQLTFTADEAEFQSSQFIALTIDFQVISVDNWGRERIEGYAQYISKHLDCRPQRREQTRLNCLRPRDSCWHAIERFFIGGFTAAESARLLNSTTQLTAQSVGLRTRQTGYLTITCQYFVQQPASILTDMSAASKRRSGAMTLDDIMAAYQRTRTRLECMLVRDADKTPK